jgi:hypothetical protein
MIDPKYYGLIEMGFTGFVVLGLAFWQLWTVWGAGKPSAEDARHPERDHEADERGS